MPRRGENIRKRKDGRWEGRYQKKDIDSCNPKMVSVYGHSYSEVKGKLKIAKEFSNSDKPQTKTSFFQDMIYMWLDSNKAKLKAATLTKYLYLIEKHIIPSIGNVKTSSLEPLIINNFINQKISSGRLDLRGGLSPSYVRTMSHIISASITFAANEGYCKPLKNPIQKPTVKDKDITILSLPLQQKLEHELLNNLTESTLGIYITLNSGLRIGEICALTWDDIDIENGVIHVRTTIARTRINSTSKKTILVIDNPKTEASLRDIPISSKMMPVLIDMKKKRKSKFVVSERESFISPRTYEYRYHKILEKCGIKKVNYHALRHTFATRCIEAGVDVKSLSEILGHSNVSITLKTYVHSSIELKRNQLEKYTAYCA